MDCKVPKTTQTPPSVSALNLTRGNGMDIVAEDSPVWRAAREAEWAEAAHWLRARGHYAPLLSVCVFNEMPLFLDRAATQRAFHSPTLRARIACEIDHLRDGLDGLVRLWK